jgi:hypothetical protein
MMVDEDTELKDSVQRLHRFVVDAVRTRRGDPFAAPVTVSEIYQDLAPYRTVRTTLGFEMNADYEHALVRMLAGVDGLTRLDPPKARERLLKELSSPNPDVTLYRDYAACDVVLNPPSPQMDWVREQLEDEAATPDATSHTTKTYQSPDWSALSDLTDSEHLDEEEETQDVEERSTDATDDTWTDPPAAEAGTAAELEADTPRQEDDVMEMKAAPAAHCAYCDSKLPPNRQLRYCPFCGADQSMQPCPSCGEALEPDWAFCIACGTAVASDT